MSSVTLAAALIVRDEEADLPACLESLAGVVDEIVVHDTGSVDSTVEIARRFGATVHRGEWTHDFAAARNVALGLVRSTWVLSLDADERLVADAVPLRELLYRSAADGLELLLRNERPPSSGGTFEHSAVRLLRAGALSWAGALHERPVRADGRPPSGGPVPPEVAHLRHLGYAAPETVLRKGARNAAVAQARLTRALDTASGVDPGELGGSLLDLGRSLVGAGRPDDAAAVLVQAQRLGGEEVRLQAGDHLARLHLAAGRDADALALADELRADGAPPVWCDWLAAQALAQLGRTDEASRRLAGVEELVDPAGRRYDPAALVAMRGLLAELRAAAVFT